MDVWARMPMKGAAKCDERCELQNSVNQQDLERMLRSWDIPESLSVSESEQASACELESALGRRSFVARVCASVLLLAHKICGSSILSNCSSLLRKCYGSTRAASSTRAVNCVYVCRVDLVSRFVVAGRFTAKLHRFTAKVIR